MAAGVTQLWGGVRGLLNQGSGQLCPGVVQVWAESSYDRSLLVLACAH